ncbi:MAG: DUF2085 domain-containing protein [Thermoplasmata archaeon]
MSSMGVLESLLMFLGSSVCHQIAERSYFLGDVQMPLCARCIGIHFGFLLSTSYLILALGRSALRLPSLGQMIPLAAVMAFYFVDAGVSYSGMSTSDNLRRTLSGLAAGIPLPFIIVPLLSTVLRGREGEVSPLATPSKWAWLVVLYALAALAILTADRNAFVFYAVSIAGVIGVFVFFGLMVSTLIVVGFETKEVPGNRKLASGLILAIFIVLALAAAHQILYPGI